MTGICRHCGKRIVLVNFALGPKWMHQPEGAAFSDSMNQFCRSTVAEPFHEATVVEAPIVEAPCVLTDRNDMEAYAEVFNEGFETAVSQGLADDPVKADEWLADHDERVRQTVIRGLREEMSNVQRALDALQISAAQAKS